MTILSNATFRTSFQNLQYHFSLMALKYLKKKKDSCGPFATVLRDMKKLERHPIMRIATEADDRKKKKK